MDFKKWGMADGGYVFLSHSHKDMDKVRLIRNYLEEMGFDPLCFFLKCLEEDAEIFQLVKREIAAREWFVYLDSQNARGSYWVPQELECAQKAGKAIIKIDLEKETSMEEISNTIASSMRVFLSYSSKDERLAHRLYRYLLSKDLQVFIALDIKFGEDFAKAITSAISEASKNGCVIVLITKYSVNSKMVLNELMYAVKENASILPIAVGDFELPLEFKYFLSHLQFLSFQKEQEMDFEKIYEVLKGILLEKNRHNEV